MRKILVISDGLFSKEELLSPVIAEKFKRFEKYGVFYDVALDTTGQRFGGKPTEFVLRIETEGAEWVEPDEEIMEKIKDAEVVVTHFSGVNSKMINAAEKLKLIGVMRSGVENVTIPAATARGIKVINCPGRVAEPVADFTVALLLAEVRNIVRINSALMKGDWGTFDNHDKANSALRNHTAGLIGFGIIGRKVATRLAAFGAKVIAYDPYCSKEDAEKLNVELVEFEDLLKRSDYVLMHARLSEDTKNLMGEKEFNLMKPSAIFVNTARAGLVDEKALIKALQEKKIRSAALDVFSQEPLPADHPLLSLNNVTLTPHRAGGTVDIKLNTVDIIIEQLDKYFAGEPLSTLMN
jgi:D-3-phosphoglycerate dehydrogenase